MSLVAAAAATQNHPYGDKVIVLPPTAQLQALLTLIRDEKTQR
jgi:hypothetical protein